MRRLFLALFLASPLFAAYTNVRTGTIDHTQAGTADSANFTIVLDITANDLKTVGNGGSVTNANCFDCVVTSDPACSTVLSFERQTYSASTGHLVIWFKWGTLSHTVDGTPYLCSGNSAITSDQSNTTAAWDSNVKARYHLEADGTDSTGNNNGTVVTSASEPSFSAGQIGNGAHHLATNNSAYIDLGTMGNLYDGSNTVETVSFWIHLENALTTIETAAYGQVTTSSSQPTYYSYVGETSTTAELTYCVTNTCASFAQIKFTSGFTFSLNTWYRVMAVLDLSTNANSKFYVNGTAVSGAAFGSGGTKPTVFNTTTAHMALFRKNTDRLIGTQDEVGFDNTGRSSSWATADYNNQKSSSTFLTWSAPVSGAANAIPVVM